MQTSVWRKVARHPLLGGILLLFMCLLLPCTAVAHTRPRHGEHPNPQIYRQTQPYVCVPQLVSGERLLSPVGHAPKCDQSSCLPELWCPLSLYFFEGSEFLYLDYRTPYVVVLVSLSRDDVYVFPCFHQLRCRH